MRKNKIKKIKILYPLVLVLILLPVAANAGPAVVPDKRAVVPGKLAVVPDKQVVVPGKPAAVPGKRAFVLDKVVAVVNNEVITWSGLYKAMEFDYSGKLRALSSGEKVKFLKDHQAGYLDRMIDMTLQLQEARRLKMSVDRKDLDSAIAAIKNKYSLDGNAFKAALKSEGLTMREYRKRLSDQILVNEVVSREVREKIDVSGAQVAKYLRAKEKGKVKVKNPQDLNSNDRTAVKGGSYRLAQIFFRMPQDPAQKKAVEKEAARALQKIRSGAGFMSVARKYSQADPDIGVISSGMLSSSMLAVLSKMKAGGVSRPFWTDHGLYILKLEDRSASGSPFGKKVQQEAKKELLAAKFEHSYKLWLKGLRDRSYVEIKL